MSVDKEVTIEEMREALKPIWEVIEKPLKEARERKGRKKKEVFKL